jgi:hypothetical protein
VRCTLPGTALWILNLSNTYLTPFSHHGRWNDDFAAYNRVDGRRWVEKTGPVHSLFFWGIFLFFLLRRSGPCCPDTRPMGWISFFFIPDPDLNLPSTVLPRRVLVVTLRLPLR